MLFPSNFLALQVAADMSDLLMNSIINTISLGHLLLHYLWFSVFLAASCFIVYAWCLLITDNYNFHSFWYRLDEELNRIQMFLRFCSLFFFRQKDPFGIWTMLQSLSLYLALLTSKNDTADKGGNSITPIRYRFMYRKKRAKVLGNKMELPWAIFSSKKKVVMGYLFSSRKESRRKKE